MLLLSQNFFVYHNLGSVLQLTHLGNAKTTPFCGTKLTNHRGTCNTNWSRSLERKSIRFYCQWDTDDKMIGICSCNGHLDEIILGNSLSFIIPEQYLVRQQNWQQWCANIYWSALIPSVYSPLWAFHCFSFDHQFVVISVSQSYNFFYHGELKWPCYIYM